MTGVLALSRATRYRLLAIAVLAFTAPLMLTACAGAPEAQPSPGTFVETGPLRDASIPGLAFVDASSIQTSAAVGVGTTLAGGSYSVLVSGEEISRLRWAEDLGTGEPVLSLWLNPDAAKRFETWTTANVGASVPVLLDGRVIMLADVFEPIEDGAIALSLDDTQSASAVDAAIMNR